MQFSDTATARTYSDRHATPEWCEWAEHTLRPQGLTVLDIGCGGGIYSRAWHRLGAPSVTGVDASAPYLEEARASAAGLSGLHFVQGDATAVPCPDHSADLIFQRALIHHLDTAGQVANARETHRLLRPHGRLVVQDRTLDDAVSDAPAHWIRATLFECFPRLIAFERARRPTRAAYSACLQAAGFQRVDVHTLDEVRATHSSFDALRHELQARKGKSILFELSDDELRHYIARLEARAPAPPIVERDPWTVWIAHR